MRKIQKTNVIQPVEYNAAYNDAVRNVVQNLLQHATLGPIGYQPCRRHGGSPIPRPGKWARHVEAETPPQLGPSRFRTEDLDFYEKMVFGCLAWGDYSTYVITGEMGSGKTSVAQWVKTVLERERDDVCKGCRDGRKKHCAPLIIYKDFNTYALIDSVQSIKNIFRKDLVAVILSVLGNIFSAEQEVERFRATVMKLPADSQLARFAAFVSQCKHTYDWATLKPTQKAERLIAYVKADPEMGPREIDEQLLYAMTLLAYVRHEIRKDPACMVFMFDNIDGLRPDAQLELLQIIVSAQTTGNIKTLVPLRLTTFEKWESNAAFVFGHIDHTGAGPMSIVRQRLEWWQKNWEARDDVMDLDLQYRTALKKRLDYFLSLWDSAPHTIEALGALCGASVRLGLYLMERVFLNNVIRFDEEPYYHAEILRSVLIDKDTKEVEMSSGDLYVHNLFASPLDSSVSLVSIRILQVAYALRDRVGERTVSNVMRTVQAADPAFTDDVVWRALNSLLFDKSPLVWVDGRNDFKTSRAAIESTEILSLTEAGGKYVEVLLRDLMYVQEALMSVSWPIQAVGRYIDYKRASSRFAALRDCLRHLIEMDRRQIASWYARKGEAGMKMSVDGDFITNRILFNLGRALIGIIRTTEFDNPIPTLNDWKSLITQGFNSEWEVLRHENLKLIELSEQFTKELEARMAPAAAATTMPSPSPAS